MTPEQLERAAELLTKLARSLRDPFEAHDLAAELRREAEGKRRKAEEQA